MRRWILRPESGAAFRPQNPSPHLFGGLSQACKSATGRAALLSGLRIHRRTFLAACRKLANPQQAVRRCFQASESIAAPFWRLVASLQIRNRPCGAAFRPQNPSPHLFGGLSQACKSATGRAALLSGLRIHRRTFLAACRKLANPQQAVRRCFQASESVAAPFWRLVASLQIRNRPCGAAFRPQNPSPHLFGGLSQACKSATGRAALLSGLRIHRRTFLAACRKLANPQQAVRRCFQASESIAAPFWRLVASLQIRNRPCGAAFRPQNPSPHLFGGLSQACKSATGRAALLSGLRIHRRTFLAACRKLANPQQAVRRRFQASESIAAPFWRLVASLQIRNRPCGAAFRPQNPSPHLFGGLSQACKSATGRAALLSGLRIRRRTFLAACRKLANPQQAVRRCFQASESIAAPFWRLVASLQIRNRPCGAAFRPQNPSPHLFGGLSQACKSATGRAALLSGLRIHRRTFLAACRKLANPQQAVRRCFQASESIAAPFWRLVASLQIRNRPCGAAFRPQNPSPHLFGGLSQACKSATGRAALLSGLRIHRRTFLAACRKLANPQQAVRRCFQASESIAAPFWRLVASLQIRNRPCGAAFRPQNPSPHLFGGLSQACKSATGRAALLSGLRIHRRTFLAACRKLANPQQAVRRCFQASESIAAPFWRLVASLQIRNRPCGAAFRPQNPSPHLFGGLSQACKSATGRAAPLSGLRIHRRTFLAACRKLANPQQAVRRCFQASESIAAPFWRLVASLQIRNRPCGAAFRPQNPSPHLFGGLSQACKSATGRAALLSGLRIHRRTFLAACRKLANPQQAVRRCFQASESIAAPFWRLVASLQIRNRPCGAAFRPQNPSPHLFGGLSQACKSATGRAALLSGLRIHRRTFLAACRKLANPQQAVRRCFQASESIAAPFWRLVASLQIRNRPCGAAFRPQNPSPHLFGGLSQACKSATGRAALLSGLRIHRRTFLAACRKLANPQQAVRRCFQASESIAAPFWRLVASLQIRNRPCGAAFRPQNPSPHLFGGLSQACKSATGRAAPLSGLRIHRRTFLAACRKLANPQQAVRRCFQASESIAAPFWRLVASLQIRNRPCGAAFRPQNPSPHLFGGLSQACKSATGRAALLSGLRIHRRTFLAACRKLANPQQAVRRCFQASESVAAPFWRLVASLQIRNRPCGAAFRPQNPSPHLFGGLSQACKSATGRAALLSGLRIHRRTFLAACRKLANPQQAVRRCFQASESIAAPFWRLVASLQIRNRPCGAAFRPQNPSPHLFGGLSQACKSATGRAALLSGLRIHRRTFLAACRKLANPQQAVRRCFQASESIAAPFWRLVASLQIRNRPCGAAFRPQNPSPHLFGGLSQACKSATGRAALLSGLRIHRRTFLAACRKLANPQQAVRRCFQASESIAAPFWRLVASLQIRNRPCGAAFRPQNPSPHLFGGLSQACKSATGRAAPLSGLRIHRRTFLAACRKLANPQQAVRRCFQASESVAAPFWRLVASLQIRNRPCGAAFRPQNPSPHLFGGLSQACKSATGRAALLSGLRINRRTFLAACRKLANPQQAVRRCFQASESVAAPFWRLVASLQIRNRPCGAAFRPQNPSPHLFGGLSQACKSATGRAALLSGLRIHRRTFLAACRKLANPQQAVRRCFQASESIAAPFWRLVASLQIRNRPCGAAFRPQNPSPHLFGGLSQACKSATGRAAPLSGLRIHRRTFLAACRKLANPQQAVRRCFQASESIAAPFWRLVASLQIRNRPCGAAFRPQNPSPHLFGGLSQACKSATGRAALLSGLRIHRRTFLAACRKLANPQQAVRRCNRRTFLAACRKLANPQQAVRRCFQASESIAAPFWRLVASLQIRNRPCGAAFRPQNPSPHLFGGLSQACKSATGRAALLSGLRIHRRTFLAACRKLANPQQAVRRCFQASESIAAPFWRLVASLQIRNRPCGAAFRPQNPSPHLFGGLSQACKSATGRAALLSGLRIHRRTFLAACRKLANPQQAVRRCFQASESIAAPFWRLVASLQIRNRPCGAAFRPQNPSPHLFGGLSQACKSATGRAALLSGLRIHRRTFLAACRKLANPQQAVRRCFQASESVAAPFWRLVASLQIRNRPCGAAFRPQNPSPHLFGGLSQACKSATGRAALLSGLRIHRRTFLAACRKLANPQQAVRRCFQASESIAAPFWRLVASLQIRNRPCGAAFRPQNPSPHLFGGLSQACKSATGRAALLSGLRIHRRTFLAACRKLANPQQAVRRCFQASESIAAPFWRLVASLQIRNRPCGAAFRPQNPSPHLFGGLSQACKSATGRAALLSGLRIHRRTFLAACRKLANPQQAVRRCFQASESIAAPFWRLVASLQIRNRPCGAAFRPQNPSPHLFGGLSQACKSATGRAALLSGLRIHRRTFLAACRKLANPQQAVRRRFQASESIAAPFWRLVASLQIRNRPCGAAFRPQNPSPHLFGGLSQACKSATGRAALLSGLRIRRRTFLAACRKLANPQQAVRRCFQASESIAAPFWRLVASLQIRNRPCGAAFRPQNPSPHLFGGLSQACKSATGRAALLSGLRIRRRTFLAACRKLANPQQAVRRCFQASESVAAPFWRLVASLQIRNRPCGAAFRPQNPSPHLFGGLSQACKSATGRAALLSGLRIHRRTFLAACRKLANPQQAVRRRFQASESIAAPFWRLVASLQIRNRPCGAAFRPQNPSPHLFGGLSQACKSATGRAALLSGLRIRRRTFLAACRKLANPQQAVRRCFQASESVAAPFWRLVASLQIRNRPCGAAFRPQNPSPHLFGGLSQACKSATGRAALLSGLRIHRRTFLAACRKLANPQQAVRRRFQASESIAAPFWRLVASLQIRNRPCGAAFRPQNPSPHLFGGLSQACKSATGRAAPLSGLRIHRRTFLAACRKLANPQQAVRRCFQASESIAAPFWRLVASLQIRNRPCGAAFRPQNPSPHLFGGLSQACKSATGRAAPLSGLRIHRRTFLAACRKLANPQQAVRRCFQASESVAAPFWRLVASLQIRNRPCGAAFRPQKLATSRQKGAAMDSEA